MEPIKAKEGETSLSVNFFTTPSNLMLLIDFLPFFFF